MFTYIIIGITVVISLIAFNNQTFFLKLQFNAYQVYYRKEYYRLITHGFIHVSWWHLFVNMFVLYFFGPWIEYYFNQLGQAGMMQSPKLIYLIFYLLSILFSSSIALFKHKDNHWYNAVGASGAVSAVLFMSIFFNPWQQLRLYAAIPVPGIIFAVLYVVYSHYMSKRSNDNVAHDAHLLGAIFGFVFPLFIDFRLIHVFFDRLKEVL